MINEVAFHICFSYSSLPKYTIWKSTYLYSYRKKAVNQMSHNSSLSIVLHMKEKLIYEVS